MPEQKLNLSEMIANVDANGPGILAAIKEGRVVVTTAEGFQKIREQKQEDTKKIFSLTADLDKTTAENIVLLNTLVFVLMSFQGVAAKGPEIFGIMEKLGISSANAQPTAKSIMMKLIGSPTLFGAIMESIKGIVAGFDPSFISRIDAEALLPILEKVQFDFSSYNALIDAAQNFPKKLPENV